MRILSLNIRGVRGGPKFSLLKHLVSSVKPDLVMFQEIMVPANCATNVLEKLFPSWGVVSSDSEGMSGGLFVAWDKKLFDFCTFITSIGILMEGLVKD